MMAGLIVVLLVPVSSATADEMTRACPEVGHHTSVESVTPVFLEGSVPKTWLDPGSSYTYTSGRSVTVTGSINASVGADFWSIARAQVDVSLNRSNTATVQQQWSWTNNTGSAQWVQLGIRGYDFYYVSYDVVAPCSIVNKQYLAHAVLPTTQPWLKHS